VVSRKRRPSEQHPDDVNRLEVIRHQKSSELRMFRRNTKFMGFVISITVALVFDIIAGSAAFCCLGFAWPD
jgi:hypothetical protein